jgi:hypothetical protein
MDLGAIITTSAGNEGVTQDISKTFNVPQYWAGLDLSLIVVGNIDSQGAPGGGSQSGSQLTVYTAGTDVICAQGDHTKPGVSRHATGTSEGT